MILRQADLALYRAKGEGRGTARFYSPDLAAAVSERRLIEQDLRLALERDELELHYQPEVALADGRLVAVEALLRWNSAERGRVEPADFLPVAESSGLIDALGDWVLTTACRQLAEWRRLGRSPPRVAVNVAASQWSRGRLDVAILDALCAHGLEAGELELEVTEGMFLKAEKDGIVDNMRQLDANRVGIVIDDFGSGYSSLGQLRQLPITKVKIDSSFVGRLGTDRDADMIIRAAVALAHELDMYVVAEGVETEGQLALLEAAGCDAVQGSLLARPVPAAQLAPCLEPGWRAAALAG
jgi:EAL domain-containing protein (putative c-di-GMP-specific phosphodiesterase class I)